MATLRSDPYAIDGDSRRLDVVDLGRRRRFSDDFKLAVVAESYAPGAMVTQVARRYGVRPGQIYYWRALARGGDMAPARAFMPVIARPEPARVPAPVPAVSVAPATTGLAPLVIMLAGGRRVEVLPGFDTATLGLVVTTLEGLA